MLTATLVIAGVAALYVIMRMMLARSSAHLRQEFQEQLSVLRARLETAKPSGAASTEIPQTVGAVAAAAAALGAKTVHVRPAKPQTTRPVGDPWAQQGRVDVWSSHDIAQRGR
jgi:hypothetical protein